MIQPQHPRYRGRTILILLCTSMLLALPALAARGGGGGGGKGGGGAPAGGLELVLVDSADGLAHHGQRVTFDVTANDADRPQVSLNCYVGGEWVYAATKGFYASYPWSKNFTLSTSGTWTSGEGDCTATLYISPGGKRSTSVASTSFHVYA